VKYDVIISGAGPSGATLAYHLARAGFEVLVLEKQFFPRDKPCGGGITCKASRLLDFPWKNIVEDTVHNMVFNFRGKSRITVRTVLPVAYMVTRSKFDTLLAEQARSAGARIVEGTALEGLELKDGLVTVFAGGKTYQGRIFAGADGVNGKSARLLGLYNPLATGPSLEAELEYPPGLTEHFRGKIKMDCGALPWGYGWIFPKANRLSTGIARFSREAKGLKQYLKEFLTREGFANTRVISVKGFPIPVNGGKKTKIHCSSALLLGDAAGLVDPLSGEGIYYALKSALLAAEAILDHKSDPERVPGSYQDLIDRQITAELSIVRRMAKVFYSFPRTSFNLIEKNPETAGRMLSLIYGEGKYAELKGAALEVVRMITSGKKNPRLRF
jgi:geranylgeranyl reductase family protein